MIGDTATCQRPECAKEFIKRTHNMKYCCDECCRLKTNERIMEKYYARRDQRQGKARYCLMCSKTRLSRYNDGTICSACESKKEASANNSVLDMLMNSSIAS